LWDLDVPCHSKNNPDFNLDESGLNIKTAQGHKVRYINVSRLAAILEQKDTLSDSNLEFIKSYISEVLDSSCQEVFGAKFLDILRFSLRQGRIRLEINEDSQLSDINLLKFHHWRHKPLADQDEQKAELDIITLEKCYVIKGQNGALIIDLSEYRAVGHVLLDWCIKSNTDSVHTKSFSCPTRLLADIYKQVLLNQDKTASILEKRIEELNFVGDFNLLNESAIENLGRKFSAQSRELSTAVGRLIEHQSTVSETFHNVVDLINSEIPKNAPLIEYNLRTLYRLFCSQVAEASSDLQTLTSTIAAFDRFVTERQKRETQIAKMKQAQKADETNLALQQSNLVVARSNLALQQAILILAVPVTTASALQVGKEITPEDMRSPTTWVLETAIFFTCSALLALYIYRKAAKNLIAHEKVIKQFESHNLDNNAQI
jgi:hypothetical protein